MGCLPVNGESERKCKSVSGSFGVVGVFGNEEMEEVRSDPDDSELIIIHRVHRYENQTTRRDGTAILPSRLLFLRGYQPGEGLPSHPGRVRVDSALRSVVSPVPGESRTRQAPLIIIQNRVSV